MAQGHRGRPPKREEDRYVRIGVTFTPSHVQLLEDLARERGVSISEVLRGATE